MKIQVALIAAGLALGLAGAPANAAPMQKAHVIKRNSHGRATMVRVSGKDYAVCYGSVKDNCINPRAAGLDFGNEPLNHWPGHPASWHKKMSTKA